MPNCPSCAFNPFILFRYDTATVKLPDRDKFWIYISEVPQRSFLYYEWYEKKEDESNKDFAKREKAKVPNEIHYFYIKDIEDEKVISAFSCPQKVVHLKYHRYSELSGQLELKVCLTSESLVPLTHPADVFKVTPQARA